MKLDDMNPAEQAEDRAMREYEDSQEAVRSWYPNRQTCRAPDPFGHYSPCNLEPLHDGLHSHGRAAIESLAPTR